VSEWGVFKILDCHSGTTSLHMMPRDAKGMVLRPHVGAVDCFCKPTRDPECPENWIHNDRERGGTNS
jgi:hypothetical protein